MKLYYVALLAGLLLGNTVLQAAETPNIGEITQELNGERPQKPRSAAQLGTAYTLVLTPLLPDMGSEDPGRRNGAQSVIERIAFRASRPGAEAERAACSKAIAAALTPRGTAGPCLAAPATRADRSRRGGSPGCRHVDRRQRERARIGPPGLAEEPGQGSQCRAAEGARLGRHRLACGTVKCPGQRRDPSNLNILVQACATDNDDVRMAALVGLANLADKSAAAPIVSAMAKGGPRAAPGRRLLSPPGRNTGSRRRQGSSAESLQEHAFPRRPSQVRGADWYRPLRKRQRPADAAGCPGRPGRQGPRRVRRGLQPLPGRGGNRGPGRPHADAQSKNKAGGAAGPRPSWTEEYHARIHGRGAGRGWGGTGGGDCRAGHGRQCGHSPAVVEGRHDVGRGAGSRATKPPGTRRRRRSVARSSPRSGTRMRRSASRRSAPYRPAT